jgi:hypothetical protein
VTKGNQGASNTDEAGRSTEEGGSTESSRDGGRRGGGCRTGKVKEAFLYHHGEAMGDVQGESLLTFLHFQILVGSTPDNYFLIDTVRTYVTYNMHRKFQNRYSYVSTYTHICDTYIQTYLDRRLSGRRVLRTPYGKVVMVSKTSIGLPYHIIVF